MANNSKNTENINLEENFDKFKIRRENEKLKEENAKLIEENAELKERIAQLMGQLEEKKKSPMKSATIEADSSLQLKLEEKSDDLDGKMEEKEVNESGKVKSIPNWLFEVLDWIKRTEMADSKLSTSSWTFKQLCWPKLHENVKPCKMENLRIDEPSSKLDIPGYISINAPLPCVSPPKYITGFNKIEIYYMDSELMQFIECINTLLNDGICFSLNYNNKIPIWLTVEQFGQFQRLFEMLAKKTFSFRNASFCDFLRFYPKADALFQNVQSIMTELNERDFDLLIQWLFKSRPDQQKPKFLEFSRESGRKSKFIDRIKEQFVGSKQCANFIIPFYSSQQYEVFSMENDQTGEMLSLYPNANRQISVQHFLVRHSKGEEHLRAEWEEQLQQITIKLPYIRLDITEMGGF